MAEAVNPRPITTGATGLVPGQSMWGAWWTKWHCDRFFSQYFRFPLSVLFHQCSIFVNLAPTFYDCMQYLTSSFNIYAAEWPGRCLLCDTQKGAFKTPPFWVFLFFPPEDVPYFRGQRQRTRRFTICRRSLNCWIFRRGYRTRPCVSSVYLSRSFPVLLETHSTAAPLLT